MAGLDADVSSYNQPLPVSPLKVAGEVGALQQQKQQIDQAKLDQANQALGYMTRAMGSLGAQASKEDYAKVAQNAVDMGLVPQNMLNTYMERLQKAPNAGAFYNEFITAAGETQKQMDYHLGRVSQNANGQTVTPTVISQKPGFGERPIGMPVQQQPPPGTPTFDESNQPRFLGAQPPQTAPGAVAGPTPLPVARPGSMPVERPAMAPPAPAMPQPSQAPATFAERTDAAFPKPTGPAAGPSPLFEEGKKTYTEDQRNAGARAFAIKPAIQALKLMPGLATGPGTEQFTNLVAAAKAWGIVDTKAENDPTVLRQELNKKLAQYVGSSPIGQRSDAAQTLAEAGSPNPKVQVTQALQALTRDAVALDRVQILKPNAFKGQDFQGYIKHNGTFPQSIDEKALTLDLLPDADRVKLVNRMAAQYKNGNADEKARANKFLETLKLAKENNIFEGAQ